MKNKAYIGLNLTAFVTISLYFIKIQCTWWLLSTLSLITAYIWLNFTSFVTISLYVTKILMRNWWLVSTLLSNMAYIILNLTSFIITSLYVTKVLMRSWWLVSFSNMGPRMLCVGYRAKSSWESVRNRYQHCNSSTGGVQSELYGANSLSQRP